MQTVQDQQLRSEGYSQTQTGWEKRNAQGNVTSELVKLDNGYEYREYQYWKNSAGTSLRKPVVERRIDAEGNILTERQNVLGGSPRALKVTSTTFKNYQTGQGYSHDKGPQDASQNYVRIVDGQKISEAEYVKRQEQAKLKAETEGRFQDYIFKQQVYTAGQKRSQQIYDLKREGYTPVEQNVTSGLVTPVSWNDVVEDTATGSYKYSGGAESKNKVLLQQFIKIEPASPVEVAPAKPLSFGVSGNWKPDMTRDELSRYSSYTGVGVPTSMLLSERVREVNPSEVRSELKTYSKGLAAVPASAYRVSKGFVVENVTGFTENVVGVAAMSFKQVKGDFSRITPQEMKVALSPVVSKVENVGASAIKLTGSNTALEAVSTTEAKSFRVNAVIAAATTIPVIGPVTRSVLTAYGAKEFAMGVSTGDIDRAVGGALVGIGSSGVFAEAAWRVSPKGRGIIGLRSELAKISKGTTPVEGFIYETAPAGSELVTKRYFPDYKLKAKTVSPAPESFKYSVGEFETPRSTITVVSEPVVKTGPLSFRLKEDFTRVSLKGSRVEALVKSRPGGLTETRIFYNGAQFGKTLVSKTPSVKGASGVALSKLIEETPLKSITNHEYALTPEGMVDVALPKLEVFKETRQSGVLKTAEGGTIRFTAASKNFLDASMLKPARVIAYAKEYRGGGLYSGFKYVGRRIVESELGIGKPLPQVDEIITFERGGTVGGIVKRQAVRTKAVVTGETTFAGRYTNMPGYTPELLKKIPIEKVTDPYKPPLSKMELKDTAAYKAWRFSGGDLHRAPMPIFVKRYRSTITGKYDKVTFKEFAPDSLAIPTQISENIRQPNRTSRRAVVPVKENVAKGVPEPRVDARAAEGSSGRVISEGMQKEVMSQSLPDVKQPKLTPEEVSLKANRFERAVPNLEKARVEPEALARSSLLNRLLQRNNTKPLQDSMSRQQSRQRSNQDVVSNTLQRQENLVSQRISQRQNMNLDQAFGQKQRISTMQTQAFGQKQVASQAYKSSFAQKQLLHNVKVQIKTPKIPILPNDEERGSQKKRFKNPLSKYFERSIKLPSFRKLLR